MSQQVQQHTDDRPNQVVHVRENSDSQLDALFRYAANPNTEGKNNSVPFRQKNLPASFFTPPEPGQRSGNHSRQNSEDAAQGRLPSFHSRVHSSPASLQATLSAAPNPPNHTSHMRHQSFDMAEDGPLPPGWEMARTPTGQRYFLNHIDQSTCWQDPRKTLSQNNLNQTTSPVQSTQNLGPLPAGWEQATTPEGELYFINHVERATSWFDPRIPMNLQRPGPARLQNASMSNPPHIFPGQMTSPPNQQTQAAPQPQQQPGTTSPGLQQQNKGHSLPPMSEAERRRQIQLQRLQMEKERLRVRQEEINRQVLVQEMMIRQLGDDGSNPQAAAAAAAAAANMAATANNDTQSVNTSGVDPFLGQVQHPRQESADSGLGGMGNVGYTLPRTPEDFLNMSNVDEMDTQEGPISGHNKMNTGPEFNNSMDLGGIVESGENSTNMDSDDLVPSLQEDISSELLNDMESVLNQPDNLTWL